MKYFNYTTFNQKSIYYIFDEYHLYSLSFNREITKINPNIIFNNKLELSKLIESQLKQYFSGSRFSFSVPLKIQGNGLKGKVLKSLLKIGYGKTLSYKEFSLTLGLRNSARAVAKIISMNNILIIVPCHRIIRKDNRLGGYSAGINIKKKLLQLEGSF